MRPGQKSLGVTLLVSVIIVANMAGCFGGKDVDGPPPRSSDAWSAAEPVPAILPRSRYGNPSEYVVFGKRYRVRSSSRGFEQTGQASWYGKKFHGRRTSSGEPFNMFELTAAHRELPIPCIAEVTNLDNGRKIRVRINDRGPFHSQRILDLSWAAATRLGIVEKGVGRIHLRVVDGSSESAAPPAPTTPRGEQSPSLDAEFARARRDPTDFIPDEPPTAGAHPQAYFLQVGAFRNPETAESSRQKFRAMGYPVSASAPQTNGWLRVWLGPWADATEAENAAAALAARGLDSLLVAQ